MSQQLIAFLGRGIEADRIIYLIVRAERRLLVAAVDGRTGCVDQMKRLVMPAGFENIIETDDVALNIHIRVVDTISDSRLSRQVYHDVDLLFLEEAIHKFLIPDGAANDNVCDRGGLSRLLNKP